MYTAMNLGGYSASEADFLRKAVAKKEEAELLKNRTKFVDGAKEQGVTKETAEQIFSDWEAFARYGFPKGHAADYAVIAVETAYLKTHYTVEYMAALLSVYQANPDKVASYVADCRVNLGIEVLPPDINRSEWDFTIEDSPHGTSSIRFGLGAIKNVGHGPVEAIMEARQDRPFKDITDLANRVDLRKVGKRALESLIKAGALDGFGPRMALLQVIERASSISASHYQAIEAGQMSFFGTDSGLVQKIILPEVDPDYNKREQLNWERELIGLFVSDHPLSGVMEDLSKNITHYSSQLHMVENQQRVKIAGMVTRIRPHITKKGTQMAFVGLEDMQGGVDLVIFPKVWQKYQDLVQYDKVVIVDGRVDTQRGEPKVLVQTISTEGTWVTNAESSVPRQGDDPAQEPVYKTISKPAAMQVAEKSINGWSDPDMPPPPGDWQAAPAQEPTEPSKQDEELPDDKNKTPNESFQADQSDLRSEVRPAEQSPEEPASTPVEKEDDTEPADAEVHSEAVSQMVDESDAVVVSQVVSVKSDEDSMTVDVPASPGVAVAEIPAQSEPQKEALPPRLTMPPLEEEALSLLAADGSPRMLTVVLRSLEDRARDILRMRRIHGMLISYPGKDRFAFYVIERNRGYRLEFPNDSTSMSEELISRLELVVGKENLIVEPITIQ